MKNVIFKVDYFSCRESAIDLEKIDFSSLLCTLSAYILSVHWVIMTTDTYAKHETANHRL